MRQNQLKAFHHVALHKGFSRAAQALNLTQPAISEQVRKLEQQYDVQLFTREHRQVQLTRAGEQLYQLTKHLFEVEDQIADLLSHSRTTLDGSLRIIADSAHHIADILARFRARYPHVFISLRTGNSAEVLSALRSYDAEIGVLGSRISSKDTDCLDLGTSRIFAIVHKDFPLPSRHGLSLAQLAKLPLVFRETGSKTRQKLTEEASRRRVRLKPIFEIEGREALRDLVASGAGIGFVSEAEFGFDARLIKLPLTDMELPMSETLVVMKQRRDLRSIRAFMRVATASRQSAPPASSPPTPAD